MREKLKVRSFQSPDDLLNAVKFDNIQINENDPNYEEVSKYVLGNKNKIIERVKQKKGFWEFLYNEGEVGDYCTLTIEMDNFIIKLELPFRDNLEAVIKIMSKKFAEESGEEKDLVTVSKPLPSEPSPRSTDDGSHSVADLRSKLKIEPLKQFQLDPSKKYDPSKVRDKLGLGLDSNIMELIHLLNLMGFETLMSCGGHEDRNKKPYIGLPWDQREKIIALLAAWEEAGGAKYKADPVERPGMDQDAVFIKVLSTVTLAEAREDIDRLTDFLNEKTGGIPKNQLTHTEITQKIRRSLGHSLRTKK